VDAVLGCELPHEICSPSLFRCCRNEYVSDLRRNRSERWQRHWIAHTFGHVRRGWADKGEHPLCVFVPLGCRHAEKERCHSVIARQATSVGVHPAKAELSFGVTQARRLAVQTDSARGVLRHALAVFVRTSLRTEVRNQSARVRLQICMCRLRCHAQQGNDADPACIALDPFPAYEVADHQVVSAVTRPLRSSVAPKCARYQGIEAWMPSTKRCVGA